MTPTQIAEAVTTINGLSNGVVILIILVIILVIPGILGLLALLVRGHNTRADRMLLLEARQIDLEEIRLKERQERQEFERNLLTGMQVSVQNLATTQASNTEIQAKSLETMDIITDKMIAFGKQQQINVKTLEFLREAIPTLGDKVDGVSVTLDQAVTNVITKLESMAGTLSDLSKEATQRGFDKIEEIFTAVGEMRTELADVRTTVHEINAKVDTQEIEAVVVIEPPASEPKAGEQ